MHRTVVILGTSHEYQWADSAACAREIDAFVDLLRSLCADYGAIAIAEEMSVDGLAAHGRAESTVAVFCKEQGLLHAYCDPDLGKQRRLGIVNEGNILLEQRLSGGSDAAVQRRISEEHLKRERVWVSELLRLDAWPVVFVCGSDHVLRVRALLEEEGVLCVVARENWCPKSGSTTECRSSGLD